MINALICFNKCGQAQGVLIRDQAVMTKILVCGYDAPCGRLVLGGYGERLCLCDWEAGRHHGRVAGRVGRMLNADFEEGMSPVMEMAMAELDEYFAGCRREFDIPLLLAGTDFQKQVWEILKKIPYGATLTYGEEAVRLGRPGAVRAVANANGANALSIFVPCHRVIGSDRSLTGYGGGLPVKKFLLELEGDRVLGDDAS